LCQPGLNGFAHSALPLSIDKSQRFGEVFIGNFDTGGFVAILDDFAIIANERLEAFSLLGAARGNPDDVSIGVDSGSPGVIEKDDQMGLAIRPERPILAANLIVPPFFGIISPSIRGIERYFE
jgi:hypothetical protein